MAVQSFNFSVNRGDTFNGASFTLNVYRTYPTLADFPVTGDVSLIYRAADTGIAYRWDVGIPGYVVTTDVNAIDLTNAKILCQFRDVKNGAQVLELTDGHGITIDTPDEGKFSIDPLVIPDTIIAGTYSFDVRVTLSNGVVRHYARGVMTVVDTSSRGVVAVMP